MTVLKVAGVAASVIAVAVGACAFGLWLMATGVDEAAGDE